MKLENKTNYPDTYLFKDTYTVIEMMSEEMREKISQKFIDFLKSSMDLHYVGIIRKDIPLREQKIPENLKIMLSNLYISYLCPKEEKEQIMIEERRRLERR